MPRNIRPNTFVNPYNFVSIPDNVQVDTKKQIERISDASLTGYIDCTLDTLSPIFIPNTTNNDVLMKRDKKGRLIKSYDFNSYEDLYGQSRDDTHASRPIIPGSALRGVMRSVYEAAVNGCFSAIDKQEKDYLQRRTDPKSPKNPGVLKFDSQSQKWTLHPAERVMLNVSLPENAKNGVFTQLDQYNVGEKVYITKSTQSWKKELRNKDGSPVLNKSGEIIIIDIGYVVAAISKAPFKGALEGYVLHGLPFGTKKHHDSVMLINPHCKILQVEEDDITRLQQVVEFYGKAKKEKQEEEGDIVDNNTEDVKIPYSDFAELIRMKATTPVFYSLVGDNLYLAPACITKEVFVNDVRSILTSQGKHQPCTKTNDLCEACSLFGMVGEDNEDALCGRLRFADATPVVADKIEDIDNYWLTWYESFLCLPELSNPKTNSAEFYMEVSRPENDQYVRYSNITYDYIQQKGQRNPPVILPKLRGRKFYWHSTTPNVISGKESWRNTWVRLIKKGKKFSSRIYFDKISEKELQKLLWVLTFGSKVCAHKIGHGKPVGLGSVQFVPTSIMVRTLENREDGIHYVMIDKHVTDGYDPYNLKIEEFEHNKQIEELALISTVSEDAIFKEVHYPWNGRNLENYYWFMANHEAGFPIFLPHILDDDPFLSTNPAFPAPVYTPNHQQGTPPIGSMNSKNNTNPNQNRMKKPDANSGFSTGGIDVAGAMKKAELKEEKKRKKKKK